MTPPRVCLLNCLYTGDIEIKDAESMIKAYGELMPPVGMVQVPHHGSINNYTEVLYEKSRLCIISARPKGTMPKHPSPDVVKKIQEKRCVPILVTDKDYTSQEFTFTLR